MYCDNLFLKKIRSPLDSPNVYMVITFNIVQVIHININEPNPFAQLKYKMYGIIGVMAVTRRIGNTTFFV